MRARKSAAARPRIQDFPGHSEAAQTSMSEQAQFPKSQSSPLLPSFSLPVELTRRQRHMQERRCTQAVHKFSRYIPNPSQLFTVPGDQESQSRYGCGFRHCRTCCWRRVGKMGQRVRDRHAGDVVQTFFFSDFDVPRSNFNNDTLMPPQHRFLASRLQSYVCRACLSKSKVTSRQQPQWLSRNATNGRGPLRSKGARQQIEQEPDVRYFEQAPDGTRVEIDMLKDFEKQIQDYEKDAGKSTKDLLGPVDFEGLLNAHGELEPLDPIEHESMAALDKETEELEALVARLEDTDLSSLSAEDRLKLREELLKLGTTGTNALFTLQKDC